MSTSSSWKKDITVMSTVVKKPNIQLTKGFKLPLRVCKWIVCVGMCPLRVRWPVPGVFLPHLVTAGCPLSLIYQFICSKPLLYVFTWFKFGQSSATAASCLSEAGAPSWVEHKCPPDVPDPHQHLDLCDLFHTEVSVCFSALSNKGCHTPDVLLSDES